MYANNIIVVKILSFQATTDIIVFGGEGWKWS